MRIYMILALLFITTGCGVKTVNTGDVGIEKYNGEVVGEPLEPGLHFYNPIFANIVEMNCQTQAFADNNDTYTKDTQQVQITYTINYNLDPKAAKKVYMVVGTDYVKKLLPPVINATIKNVVGQWDAMELISSRAKAIDDIQAKLITTMAENGIIVSRFEITNLQFNKAYEEAVEAKVVATQRAQEAVNHTKQIQEEANQKVISAKAEAESMKIRSDALSQNANLVQYEAVKKWDGTLPGYMVVGNSSQIPFINFQGSKKD